MSKAYPARLGCTTHLTLVVPAEELGTLSRLGYAVEEVRRDNNLLVIILRRSEAARYHFGAVRQYGGKDCVILQMQGSERDACLRMTGEPFGLSNAQVTVAEDAETILVQCDMNLAARAVKRSRAARVPEDAEEERVARCMGEGLGPVVKALNRLLAETDGAEASVRDGCVVVSVMREYQ